MRNLILVAMDVLNSSNHTHHAHRCRQITAEHVQIKIRNTLTELWPTNPFSSVVPL